MTEAEVYIRDFKKTISVGKVLLAKLEVAQKDLEESSPHKWEHGDVFRNNYGVIMIFIENPSDGRRYVFCISGPCHCGHSQVEIVEFLNKGEFLFNIKEKL